MSYIILLSPGSMKFHSNFSGLGGIEMKRSLGTTSECTTAKKDLKKLKEDEKHGGGNCAVFLGGSCNPTTWRKDIVIPKLNELNISFYNPQVSTWRPELMEAEHRAKESCPVLFFLIDNQTRAVAATLEVAYLGARGKNIILVLSGLQGPGNLILNEPISLSEYEELTYGQIILQHLVSEHKIPVFNEIHEAISWTEEEVKLNLQDDLEIKRENGKIRDRRKNFELAQTHSYFSSKNSFLSIPEVRLKIENEMRRIFSNFALTYSRPFLKIEEIHSKFFSIFNIQLQKENIAALEIDILKIGNFSNLYSNGFYHEKNENLVKLETDESQTTEIEVNYELFSAFLANYLYSGSDFGREYLNNLVSSRENCRKYLKMLKNLKDMSEVSNSKFEKNFNFVYLGGSYSSDDKWREEKAVPFLNENGVSFYNGEENCRARRNFFLPPNLGQLYNSELIFFYLSKKSRGMDLLILAAYFIGRKKNVVLCVEDLEENSTFNNELLTSAGVKDYNRGRSYIKDIGERSGISVFNNLELALAEIVKLHKIYTKTQS